MHATRPFQCFPCSFVLVAALVAQATAPARAADDPTQASQQEQQLLEVLRSADSPAADKAITCKKLAIHGSSKSVPELAKLLPDPRLASWARIALEAIPGPEADEALRTAAESLEGELLVGVINSIGVRQDSQAVEVLASRLQDEDPQVASAAAVALGHVGVDAAAQTLRKTLASAPASVRSAVAEGCVLCAERRMKAGRLREAAEIYDEVRVAKVADQRVLDATRGAILARGEQGISMLLDQFRSNDKERFQLALSVAREFPGGEVDKALAQQITRTTPRRAALIIQAMSDRPETVVLPAIVKAARQGPKRVRLAAIESLQRVGDVSCLDALLEIALQGDAELTQSAKATMANLPGDEVDSRVLALLPEAEGKTYPVLIELVGQRRIAATAMLLKALEHDEQAVRTAALAALGETVAEKDLPVLISLVVEPQRPEDKAAAQRALKAASIRMPDREACAARLVEAMEQASATPTKASLLEILGAMGGAKALQAVAAAGQSDDDQLQDVATRLLGEWMTADAAPVLLDLADNAKEQKYQIRALRGYIRIARQFVMPTPQRIEMCRRALDAAQRTAERQLVLEVLKRYPHPGSLKLAVDLMQDAELKAGATEAALTIAQRLGRRRGRVSELLARAGLKKVKLEIVKAEYGSGSTQKDVTATLRKHAGDTALVMLPSSYNASLGGDPAPGTPKQLKIQYRIDGKAGEATFEENSPILLPMPK